MDVLTADVQVGTRMIVKMIRRIVRCPYGGHHFQVEFEDIYATARAVPKEENSEGIPGHNQVCPICNRMLFIKYIPPG
jgi:hypothetical protein